MFNQANKVLAIDLTKIKYMTLGLGSWSSIIDLPYDTYQITLDLEIENVFRITRACVENEKQI